RPKPTTQEKMMPNHIAITSCVPMAPSTEFHICTIVQIAQTSRARSTTIVKIASLLRWSSPVSLFLDSRSGVPGFCFEMRLGSIGFGVGLFTRCLLKSNALSRPANAWMQSKGTNNELNAVLRRHELKNLIGESRIDLPHELIGLHVSRKTIRGCHFEEGADH